MILHLRNDAAFHAPIFNLLFYVSPVIFDFKLVLQVNIDMLYFKVWSHGIKFKLYVNHTKVTCHMFVICNHKHGNCSMTALEAALSTLSISYQVY